VRTRGPREAALQPASGSKENEMPNPNGKWKVELWKLWNGQSVQIVQSLERGSGSRDRKSG